MHKQFEIFPSRLQLGQQLALLTLAAAIALVYVESLLLQSIYLSAILLLAVGEIQSMRRARPMQLRLNQSTVSLALGQGDQPYFYIKYKVYRTRWFAILKLIDRHKNRTLILYSDSFNSPQAYLDCRFLLGQLEPPTHVD